MQRSLCDVSRFLHYGAIALVVPALLLAVVSGCGSDRPTTVPVSGTVLLDGQPLKSAGTVRVIPKGARPATGEIDPATGRFTLTTFDKGDGCVKGSHTATVTARETLADNQIRWNAPEKYSQPGTSLLTVKIDGPTDKLEIKLESGGAAPAVKKGEGGGDADPTAL